MKIVFFTGSLSQPRIIRRIETIHKAGFECKVYGLDTGIYTQNKLATEIDTVVLGTSKDGKAYFKKFWQTLSKTRSIVKKEKKITDLFYAFGMKHAIMLALFGVPFVYEISDILYAYPKFDKVRSIFKHIDKWIIKRSKLTVMTSAGFQDWLGLSNSEKIIIQPNKLNRYFVNRYRIAPPKLDINHLRFGFVGAPRSPYTIGRFAKVVGEKFPQHCFLIYGESSHTPIFKSMLKDYSNVKFMGSFKNPDDFEKIYANIDIVVSAYETAALNERILDANKLYESIYFRRPVVMSSGTFSEEQVHRYGCGYAINASSDNEIEQFINTLNINELERIVTNESKMDATNVIDNSDELLKRISAITNHNSLISSILPPPIWIRRVEEDGNDFLRHEAGKGVAA